MEVREILRFIAKYIFFFKFSFVLFQYVITSYLKFGNLFVAQLISNGYVISYCLMRRN